MLYQEMEREPAKLCSLFCTQIRPMVRGDRFEEVKPKVSNVRILVRAQLYSVRDACHRLRLERFAELNVCGSTDEQKSKASTVVASLL